MVVYAGSYEPMLIALCDKHQNFMVWLIIAVLQTSTNDEEGDKNNSAEPSTSTDNSAKDMEGTLMFQELLKDLPGKVSGQTAKNLSVPIAFVCLLHLANEKVRIC